MFVSSSDEQPSSCLAIKFFNFIKENYLCRVNILFSFDFSNNFNLSIAYKKYICYFYTESLLSKT